MRMTASRKYLAPSKESHNFAEHWINSSQWSPSDDMTLYPPRKGFPRTFVRQQIHFRQYPFCFNLNHVFKHMQMYPLSTAIKWGTGASRRVPPTFGAYVVHLHRGEFPWTKICERFKCDQRGQELHHTYLNFTNPQVTERSYAAPLVLTHLPKKTSEFSMIRVPFCEP